MLFPTLQKNKRLQGDLCSHRLCSFSAALKRPCSLKEEHHKKKAFVPARVPASSEALIPLPAPVAAAAHKEAHPGVTDPPPGSAARPLGGCTERNRPQGGGWHSFAPWLRAHTKVQLSGQRRKGTSKQFLLETLQTSSQLSSEERLCSVPANVRSLGRTGLLY